MSEKLEVGYKVVMKKRNQCVSAMAHNHIVKPAYTVVYSKTSWAKPRRFCGPLAVFSNEEDAAIFALGYHPPKQVWLCIYEKHPTATGLSRPGHRRSLSGLPRGTVLARKVLLVKRV